ncbi:MAG: PfkB family carbohydrate kinase, partial [Propionibacteriaceae bacterium]|nr:PfkB family carbohydrate kinase [Propionibacteriaceae bacterium]
MIVTVTVNPALDRTAGVEKLRIGGLNRLGEVVEDCGGKGVNVSKAVAALGGESVATGFMGGGAAGESLLGLIDAVAGVRAGFVPVAAPARVNLKIVETVGGVLTEFNEAGAAVTPGEVDALTAKLAGQAVPGAVFVFSGSLCPGLPEDCYATWIALAHEAGATALLDASGQALRRGLVARPDLVKPNWPELADLVG